MNTKPTASEYPFLDAPPPGELPGKLIREWKSAEPPPSNRGGMFLGFALGALGMVLAIVPAFGFEILLVWVAFYSHAPGFVKFIAFVLLIPASLTVLAAAVSLLSALSQKRD